MCFQQGVPQQQVSITGTVAKKEKERLTPTKEVVESNKQKTRKKTVKQFVSKSHRICTEMRATRNLHTRRDSTRKEHVFRLNILEESDEPQMMTVHTIETKVVPKRRNFEKKGKIMIKKFNAKCVVEKSIYNLQKNEEQAEQLASKDEGQCSLYGITSNTTENCYCWNEDGHRVTEKMAKTTRKRIRKEMALARSNQRGL